jgi:hypothetical protein
MQPAVSPARRPVATSACRDQSELPQRTLFGRLLVPELRVDAVVPLVDRKTL